MNRVSGKEKVLKNWLVVLALAIPALAWGQHNKTSSAPAPHVSAPAPHASAPAPHASAPARSSAPQHSAPTSHTSNTSRTPTTGTSRTNTTAGHANTTTSRTNTSTGHTNTTAGHTNTPASRTNATTSHNTTAGHTNTTSGRTNTTAGHTNTTAGHTNTTAGHTNTTATHTNPTRTPPGKTVSLKGGGTASVRPNGKIRSVDRNGMHIQHSVHGSRTVVATHNGARVVTTGRHGGYVQRAYVSRNGRSYVSRTYVVNNVSYTSVYRSYGYGGYCCYYGYSPAFYYNPGYYGWAYNPWPAPVAYGWGWGGAPWYGYYGGYFEPYPVYPSAAFWLTDYLIAANLQAAYAAQAEAETGFLENVASDNLYASMGALAAPAADTRAVLSAEVKKALAEEVKTELATEKAAAAAKGGASGGQAASNEPPPALDPAWKIFVVSSDLDETVDGQECGLTPGDVITRISDKPDADRNVTAKVTSSKKTDCAVGKEVLVAVDDLQEMHNKFREQLSGGMKSLAEKQGTGGLPKAPDTSTVAGEVPAPPADTTAAKTLQEQQAAADQTESQVKQEAAGSTAGGLQ